MHFSVLTSAIWAFLHTKRKCWNIVPRLPIGHTYVTPACFAIGHRRCVLYCMHLLTYLCVMFVCADQFQKLISLVICASTSLLAIFICACRAVSESRLNGDTHFSTSWPALFVSACAKHTFRNWFHWWLWVGNRWSSRLHLVSEKDDCWRKDAYECRWLHSGASTKHFTCSRTPSDSDFIQEPILGTCT